MSIFWKLFIIYGMGNLYVNEIEESHPHLGFYGELALGYLVLAIMALLAFVASRLWKK